MRSAALKTFAAFAVAAGSGSARAAEPAESIVYVSAKDAEMNAAVGRGRATLSEFYAHLARPGSDESDFLVKFDIVPGENSEFVWAANLDRSRKPMTGELVNQPELTEHKIGERVTIAERDIIDWSYRKGGVSQGGFTTRVLLKHMSAEEAAEMRDYLGW